MASATEAESLRAEALRAEIAYHNLQYHQLDQPIIPDAEFDRLMAELRIIAPAIGRSICLEPVARRGWAR